MKKSWRRTLVAAAVAGLALSVASGAHAGADHGHKGHGHKGHGHGAHWGYEGEGGPEHWGDLSDKFRACKEGTSQSPIDIRGAKKANLPEIRFNYSTSKLSVINNGHTIKLNYDRGSTITVGGKTYELVQFHFHSPSEHKIDGKAYDMVAHLVHMNTDKELAVVSVLFKIGAKNAVVDTIWKNLPDTVGKEKTLTDVTIDVRGILPFDRSYYHYMGSLTTPPCSEGVSWYVLKEPVEVSRDQVSTFTSLFPKSVRPVQPINEREIKEN
ncbi:MAG TPA: carbonic anhydrase family protein [Deltaproteobacteria bacterium]|nr:carbonic anhydrase family protein [Deltaproteobacteria bacterium]